jgi:anti-sigma regulatory factor (Ser/Thr protein kinase)
MQVAGLRHGALVYESPEEFAAFAVPFLREGLEAGEGAVVAHTQPGLALMREALGADAAAVTFVDVGEAYTRPARLLASYHELFVEQLGLTPSVRAIADVQFGPDPQEWNRWTAYEAVTNRSFAHLPAWVVCSYNAEWTPEPVIDGVWRTHREVFPDGEHGRFEDPDALLRELAPEPRELDGLRSIGVGRDLEDFRERLARELAAEDVGEDQALGFLLAATELAANALEHGGGVEDVRVGRADGRFVCEVVDRGAGFDDPAAGYLAPRPGVGRGLWLVRQLAWELELFHAEDGFTARIWL